MPKDPPLGIRLEPAEKAALDRASKADQRSMSALGRKIIADWLRKEGWMESDAVPAPKPATKPSKRG